MNSKQKFIIGLVFLTMLNVGILQQWQISNLSNQLDISDMRAKVNTEFADELLWLQINDIEQLTKDNLIAHGKLQGMVDYYAQDEGTRNQIDSLWHEGYMRGLGQTEWEYDALSESNYNKGYKEALEKAFPGELIINSKIVFSVLFILNSLLSLCIMNLFKSILILSNSITLLIFFDFVLFKIFLILRVNSFGSKGFGR